MGGTLSSLFSTKKQPVIVAPTPAQSAAAASQTAAVAAQEKTVAANAAAAAASLAARGSTGRALLLNDEVGLAPVASTTVTKKTLGA